MQGKSDLWRRGDPAVLATACGLLLSVGLLIGIVLLVIWSGIGVFWAGDMKAVQYDSFGTAKTVVGPLVDEEPIVGENGEVVDTRINLKQGNRDVYGIDFVWIDGKTIQRVWEPEDIVRVERMEWGDSHVMVKSVDTEQGRAATNHDELFAALVAAIDAQPDKIKGEGAQVVFETIDGREVKNKTGEIVHAIQPNKMSFMAKVGRYLGGMWDFVFGAPRESNTEGGIWPALFGTCMMVIIMSVAVMPLGVVAAVYLHEYATQGPLVRAIRVAIANLAGVPSIVFGLFGLGFFIHAIGGSIDSLFFDDKLPTPTFGTGGILWASLTLALLTLPVVIVATEESLSAVPSANREGALALGCTKWQAIWRVVLPQASPGILTGLILAVARGAGEVAPLMLTGAVKIAPEMPFDAEWPFFHLDRKFMHLGFHIYDLGFQSPNVEAAKPMVYATTLLLIALVVTLNVSAIQLRNRLRRRMEGSAF